MRKKLIWFFFFLLVLEVSLRFGWGFGDPVIYKEDSDFEYIYAPDQNVNRFGHHIRTNAYSMRSDKITAADSVRILFIGDSVINGGTQTDNDKLASSILQEKLSALLNKKVNVLNISAGSWGPDNAAAYLRKYGTFNAELMVMVFSSHDAYDNMTHEKIVGIDPSYPDHKPFSAIGELITRYALPAVKEYFHPQTVTSDHSLMINKNGKTFNKGWNELISMSRSKKIPLLIVLHAEQDEVNDKSYNKQGQLVIDSLSTFNITPVRDLDAGFKPSEYRDYIHLNEAGQAHLADLLLKPMLETLQHKD